MLIPGSVLKEKLPSSKEPIVYKRNTETFAQNNAHKNCIEENKHPYFLFFSELSNGVPLILRKKIYLALYHVMCVCDYGDPIPAMPDLERWNLHVV